MIVSVHQPHYLPWLGYFDKIDTADVFVVLDTVQFEKNGWQNRNKIKTAQGWMWMTVPVKHDFGTSIAQTGINTTVRWRKKHRQALLTNYSKSLYFDRYMDYFETVYGTEYDRLCPLNTDMLGWFAGVLGIETGIVAASDMNGLPDEPNERLAEIVKRLGGDVYLAGAGCGDYFDERPFRDNGIRVVFQDYEPVEYPQLYGEFIPRLAVVDALFNCGDGTLDIIRNGRRTRL